MGWGLLHGNSPLFHLEFPPLPYWELAIATVFLQKIRYLLLFSTPLPNWGKIPLYSARGFPNISPFSLYSCEFSAPNKHVLKALIGRDQSQLETKREMDAEQDPKQRSSQTSFRSCRRVKCHKSQVFSGSSSRHMLHCPARPKRSVGRPQQKMEIVVFVRQNSMGVTALLQSDESFANVWLLYCLVNIVPTQAVLTIHVSVDISRQ